MQSISLDLAFILHRIGRHRTHVLLAAGPDRRYEIAIS